LFSNFLRDKISTIRINNIGRRNLFVCKRMTFRGSDEVNPPSPSKASRANTQARLFENYSLKASPAVPFVLTDWEDELTELDEFWSLFERPVLDACFDAFELNFPAGWSTIDTRNFNLDGWFGLTHQQQHECCQILTDAMRRDDIACRVEASRQLLYIALGKYAINRTERQASIDTIRTIGRRGWRGSMI
jgi:hypothetical protein